jgi:chemotaxis family two-component system sensor kinase Cph1
VTNHPAFGQADLTNCERELIHLAGSIQPHGVFLAVEAGTLQILQTSANAPALLAHDTQALLGRPVALLGGDIDPVLRALAASRNWLLRCRCAAP